MLVAGWEAEAPEVLVAGLWGGILALGFPE